MSRHISDARKAAFYGGALLQLVGMLLFLSVFASFAFNIGNFNGFEGQMKSGMFRALSGMALLWVGGMVRKIGARGLAGSGVILDPDKARDELEPYSRMAGGMVKDAVDEAGVIPPVAQSPVIMVKCTSCGTLNQEAAKFCQECGKPM